MVAEASRSPILTPAASQESNGRLGGVKGSWNLRGRHLNFPAVVARHPLDRQYYRAQTPPGLVPAGRSTTRRWQVRLTLERAEYRVDARYNGKRVPGLPGKVTHATLLEPLATRRRPSTGIPTAWTGLYTCSCDWIGGNRGSHLLQRSVLLDRHHQWGCTHHRHAATPAHLTSSTTEELVASRRFCHHSVY
jgi:hypothetical protein